MERRKPILLVGNCGPDARAVEEALGEMDARGHVIRVADAADALALLRKRAREMPAVILLSVGESEHDNLDLLRTIKADERLKSIPVVVLAASDDVQTVNESFTLGAAGYMVKSTDGDEFAEKVRMIQTYWNLSELPRQH